jgi:hypothetical protein
LQGLAWLLDSSIRLPGGYRIGLDGILGLVPGVGDLVAALLSSYIVVEAARLRVPGSVLLRMVSNIGLELVIGVVPVLGDLFDLVFKANERNVRLIGNWLDQPHETQRESRWGVVAVLLILGLLLALAIALVGGLAWLVWSALAAT